MSAQPLRRDNVPDRHLIILLAILLAGAAIRLFRLGYQSIWNDEAISATVANGSLSQIVTNQFQSLHPPGYYLLLHFWQDVFGNSELALRMPSALAGIAGILSIYLLGRHLFSPSAGLWAALLTAVLPFTLFYSQEARSYSTLFLLSIWVIFSQAKIWQSDRRRWWAIYLLVSLLGLYMHFFFALIVGTMGLYFVLRKLRSPLELPASPLATWRSFLVVHTLMALALVPVLFWGLAQMSAGESYWISDVSLGGFLSVPLSFTAGHFLPGTWMIIAFGLILFLVFITMLQAVRAYVQKSDARSGLTLALMSYWLPILIAYAISLIWIPLNLPRLMIVAAPGLYLLLGWGAAQTRERLFNASLLIALVAVSLVADYNWLFDEAYHRPPARDIAAFIADEVAPSERVIYANDSGFRLMNHYLPQINHYLYFDQENANANPQVDPDVIRLMGGGIITPTTPAQTGSFWLVIYPEFDVALQEDIYLQFESQYTQVDSYNVAGVTLVRYDDLDN